MGDHDQNVTRLFGGEHIPEGYRGRTNRTIRGRPSRWVIAYFLAVLFGFSTAATAITFRLKSVAAQTDFHSSLPANFSARDYWATDSKRHYISYASHDATRACALSIGRSFGRYFRSPGPNSPSFASAHFAH